MFNWAFASDLSIVIEFSHTKQMGDGMVTASTIEKPKWHTKGYELDMGWMDQRGEWGAKAQPGKHGLTLDDISIGSYGAPSDHSDNRTGRPRGSTSRRDGFRIGAYSVFTKSDIWLANAASLYEEALQRQWSSATDVPWDSIKPLPDDIERAECQLATFLTEVEFVAGDVPGRWVSWTSPDYMEPRLFLITQIMDEARHLDVFRKRALVNGGGLLQQPGPEATAASSVGSIDVARDFTEMSARLHISGEGSVLTIFRTGELMAYNEAEKRIYRLAAQDESRHVAFGVMHLRYVGETAPERREEIHYYLDDGEEALVRGNQNPLSLDSPSHDALGILLGRGKENIDEGHNISLAIQKRQVKEYIQRVHSAGFSERFENGRANPELMKYIQN